MAKEEFSFSPNILLLISWCYQAGAFFLENLRVVGNIIKSVLEGLVNIVVGQIMSYIRDVNQGSRRGCLTNFTDQ